MASARFIVIADSHIRFPDDEVEAYPSNALMVQRNEFVVDLCNQIEADLVVHLGDIVHPLPVEDSHEAAVRLAKDVYAPLKLPIHFVPGNHDIGDKPHAHVAVPAVADGNYGVFEEYWGEPFRSFDIDDCHFVIVDTPVLNSGLGREGEQHAWLEADLADATSSGKRIFVFSHYPPFIRDRDEREHYDNLGEPARSWFLDLLKKHRVEAVFSGHVHNFLYNRDAGTELYVLPATGFVRPDYSELAAVSPEAENGRNDPPKLGFFVVDVDPQGHRVTPIRTGGRTGTGATPPVPLERSLDHTWRSPVGVTLRHSWMSEVGFPTSGLDEFARKVVRNDATLLSLWEARIDAVRIPVDDLATATGRTRVAHLAERGMRFTVRSAGVPTKETGHLVVEAAAHIERWELVVPPGDLAGVAETLKGLSLPDTRLALAPLVPIGAPHAAVHHFVSAGFDSGEAPLLEKWRTSGAMGVFDEVVFRTTDRSDLTAVAKGAVAAAAACGKDAVLVVELPRGSESIAFADDDAVADRVGDAARMAQQFPELTVFLDAFMDHDRSYYPRHGLIDRHHNPRLALHRLIEVAATQR